MCVKNSARDCSRVKLRVVWEGDEVLTVTIQHASLIVALQ